MYCNVFFPEKSINYLGKYNQFYPIFIVKKKID